MKWFQTSLATAFAVAATAQAAVISQYSLEEGTGTTVTQSVAGGAPNGTIVGAATWVDGIAPGSGEALQITTGSRVEMAASGIWQNLGGFSVSLWIQPSALAGGGHSANSIFWMGTSAGSARFAIQLNDGGDLRAGGRRIGTEANFNTALVTGSNTTGVANNTNDPISVGQLYHIAATANYQTGLLSLYLNGVLLDSDTITAWGTGNSAAENLIIRLGNNAGNSEQFQGIIDDVRIYNTALTPTEVAALVPEPSVVLLGGFGLIGLAARRRRH